MTPRRIAVVTGSRADYGIYRPVLREIESRSGLSLSVLVCGTHLSDLHGRTVADIEADGFPIDARIDTLMPEDSPADIARSISKGIRGFATVLETQQPDLLLVLGDRYEMFAAASAAQPFALPLAHIHGGETTEGAIDEAFRHAITKMSHIHFAATEPYADRIIRMGEQPGRVQVTGAPGLDNVSYFKRLQDTELQGLIGLPLDPSPILVTFHPVTREFEKTDKHIAELLAALREVGRPVIFTYPNADTHGRAIIEAIDQYVKEQPSAHAVKSLGTRGYFSLMMRSAAMVGNSSSGILEAASFELPVVDIGNRQKGRIRGVNVLHAETRRDDIVRAIRKATAPEFREGLRGMTNPYGDGAASGRIVDALASCPLDGTLLRKEFYDGL